MNMINNFKKFDIPFSWEELKIGRCGVSTDLLYLPEMLTNEDVMLFTVDYVSRNMSSEDENIWLLAGLTPPYDDSEIVKLLSSIVNSEDDISKPYYRWVWILVQMMLTKVKKLDYLEALFEINEFWSDLQSPTFMPYEFQGIGNKLSPKDFYTKEHLEEVITRHEAWLIEKKPIISN